MPISYNLSLLFGHKEPTEIQKKTAKEIIELTPKGPTPYKIALSFISGLPTIDSRAISQWPENDAWNPLIVEFFSSTDTHVSDDMTAWCAAFVNWCFERSKVQGTRSASSQSFLASSHFKKVEKPTVGDLAIFTCYDGTGNSLGLGHVGFVHQPPTADKVDVLGGNQMVNGVKMIAVKSFATGNHLIERTIDKRKVKCMMRLNSYARPWP